MTVIEKANELGLLLKESAEFVRLQKAQEEQMADTDAQLMLMNYNKKRDELVARASKENITKDEMQAIRNEMETEFNKLNQNAKIVDLEEFDMTPAVIIKSDGTTLYITRDIAAAIDRRKSNCYILCIS